MTAETTPTPVTAEWLLAELRRLNPGVRYAAYHNGSAVGEWVPTSNRFAPLYERTIDGRWLFTVVNGMIKETLINGESAYKPDGWRE